MKFISLLVSNLPKSSKIRSLLSNFPTPLIYSESIPPTIGGGGSTLLEGNLRTSDTESTINPTIFSSISTTTIRVSLSGSFFSKLNRFLRSITGIILPRKLINILIRQLNLVMKFQKKKRKRSNGLLKFQEAKLMIKFQKKE